MRNSIFRGNSTYTQANANSIIIKAGWKTIRSLTTKKMILKDKTSDYISKIN